MRLGDVRFGEDYDVIANLGGIMVYVEVKSSAPSEVDDRQLAMFFERAQELTPEIAILMVDTESDLEAVGFFKRVEDVMAEAIIPNSPHPDLPLDSRIFRPDSEHPGIRYGRRRHYICNSEPRILTQLQRCVRNFHREVRDVVELGVEQLDFVAAAERLAVRQRAT